MEFMDEFLSPSQAFGRIEELKSKFESEGLDKDEQAELKVLQENFQESFNVDYSDSNSYY